MPASIVRDPERSEGPLSLSSKPPQTPSSQRPERASHRRHRGLQSALVVLIVLGLTAILPPLVNVNRYQRRIAGSIAQSLGRSVHMDAVTMNLLPVPGFTLSNFVVGEDPAFGSEPVIRAPSVRANLRLRSLWHRRVEFSRINLDQPSVNLVQRADGRWNIENVLLSASRIPVVPTDQPSAAPGDIQRFPYIEATGARVNFKEGLEKRPVSLTDADFALWLPQPQLWRLRLTGHPTRTDTNAADTGILRLQGTFGKASALNDVPIDLQADWVTAPLGAVSSLLLGHDAGLRADLTLHLAARGTLSESVSSAHLELRALHRADFVPAQSLDLDLNCNAQARSLFHRLSDLQCASMSSDGGGIGFTGDLPDLRDWRSAVIEAKWQAVPASMLVKVLHGLSRRPADLDVSGTFNGHASCCANVLGSLNFSNLNVGLPAAPKDAPSLLSQPSGPSGDLTSGILTLSPIPLELGGLQPALLNLRADRSGLKLRLTGSVMRSRLLALADALPIFGEALPQALPVAPVSPPEPAAAPRVAASPAVPTRKLSEVPLRLDLAATRPWGSPQTWTLTAPPNFRQRSGSRARRTRP